MPRRGAQVRGNVPKVRIVKWSIEKERIIIENKNPQVRSLIRDRVHKRKQIKKEMNR